MFSMSCWVDIWELLISQGPNSQIGKSPWYEFTIVKNGEHQSFRTASLKMADGREYMCTPVSGYPDFEARKIVIHHPESGIRVNFDIRTFFARILRQRVVMIWYLDTQYTDCFEIRTFRMSGYWVLPNYRTPKIGVPLFPDFWISGYRSIKKACF